VYGTEKELAMRSFVRCLLTLGLIFLFSAKPVTSHAIVFGCNVLLSTPTDGKFFEITPPGLAYVQVETNNETRIFLSDAIPIWGYTVNWQMAVGEIETTQIMNSDVAFYQSATTDGNGYWYHNAHNTGLLSGYNDFPEGEYQAYGHVGGTCGALSTTLTDIHDFTVGPG
jgi:hypothetical protein